jgi:2-oxoisovalerate dehydrogenase E2 component (dihydrolipoyl transacylase)
MSRFVFNLPDLGEGTVESELVAWHVTAGDEVREGQMIAEMATEKAAIELPSPVTGRVVATHGGPGDFIAVGAPLIEFETPGEVAARAATEAVPAPARAPAPAPAPAPAATVAATPVAVPAADRTRSAVTHGGPSAGPVRTTAPQLAAPATRRRAREAGIDLTTLAGSGPDGRIERRDVEAAITAAQSRSATRAPASALSAVVPDGETEEIRIIGVRRVIAARVAEAKRTIPHFTYVEEVDVTDLDLERERRNAARAVDAAKLSLLPFVVAALARVLRDHPQCNARYDAAREVLVRYRAVHVGIATQTAAGLKVPVVRHAERLGLLALAAEIARLAAAARDNTASREELGGSTITVTSLGRLGGIVSTPVINAPEVAIIGVNRVVERPVVREGRVVVRRMVNLSSSFDHRFIDGYDAAVMIQALKQRLEDPAGIAPRPGP